MNRLKLITTILFLLGGRLIHAQTAAIPVFSCENPGVNAITSGLRSSNYLQGIIPSCSVTVYLTGTTTKATIYKNPSNSPQDNPFTANIDGSIPPIYAATGQGYDVVLSGGIPPFTYVIPVSRVDLFAGGGSGGGATIAATTTFIKGTSLGNQGVQANPADLAAFLSGLTNCTTSGYSYSPGSDACVPSGGSSAGAQFSIQTAALSGAFTGTAVAGIGFFSTSAIPRAAVLGDVTALWTGGGCGTSTNFMQIGGNCSASTATPGGSDTQVQINVAGVFGTDSGYTYNVATHVLSIPGQFIQSSTNVPVHGGNFYGNSSFYTENRSAYTMLHTSGVGSLVPTTAGSNPGQDFHGLGQLLSNEALSVGESTQIVRNINATFLTSGQDLMDTGTLTCATNGDCISEWLQMIDYGGCGQPSEECFHGNWLLLTSATSAGPCLSGCSANSTAIDVGNATAKMGQGLILYDASVSSSINITGNTTIGGLPWYVLTVSGLTHGVSTYYQVTNAVTVLLDPGTNRSFVPPAVSITISASPSYTGAASSTASVASSGYGCLANPPGSPGYEEYEYVPYTTVDGTHFNIYPWHDHAANAIFAIGGDCGYGLAQHATTTVQGSPVVVPIVATIDSTHVIYAGSNEGYGLGKGGQHGYQNASCVPTVVSRSEVGSTWYNFITVPTCGTAQGLWTGGLNLTTVTIAGIVVDTTFNASNVQLTGTATAGVYSYATSATNVVAPTSLSAGTVTAGDITATMYPVSQVVVPNDPASSNSVDGWILTSPWVALNASDTVSTSLPAYSNPNGDLRTLGTTEDPLQGPAGYQVTFQSGGSRDAAGSGTTGFYALNLGSSSNYRGFGGVYSPPAYAFRVKGFFQTGLFMDAPLAGDANTTASVYVDSSDLNNIPGLPCYSYFAFEDSFGPHISVGNCINGGDSASQSITMDAPNVHLGTTAAGFWINRGDAGAGAIGTYLYGALTGTCSSGLALNANGMLIDANCPIPYPTGAGVAITTGTAWGTTIPVGNTGTDIPQLSSGLLSPSILPVATTGAFGAVKPDGTSITISGGVISATGTITGSGTANIMTKWTAASAIGNSLATDNGTTLMYTGSGGIAAAPGTGAGGGYSGTEGTAATTTSGVDNLWSDSTQHMWMQNLNGGANFSVPLGLSLPLGTPTFITGTGVTSVVCTAGYTCTNTRGELTIVGGTATTGTIATITFSAALSATPACFVSANGSGTSSTTFFDLGHGTPSTTSFTISAGVTVTGVTLNVDYRCQP